jgi:hypothetical protein
MLPCLQLIVMRGCRVLSNPEIDQRSEDMSIGVQAVSFVTA